MLFSLYPQTRIRLAEMGLSSVCDELADVVADFFLDCRWPCYRDEVEMDGFLSLLRQQGEKLGLPPWIERTPGRQRICGILDPRGSTSRNGFLGGEKATFIGG